MKLWLGAEVGQSPAHCEDAHEAANFVCVDTIVCSNARDAEREALPAYADGDRVEYFSPTCGLWLLGEATRKQSNEEGAQGLCCLRCP